MQEIAKKTVLENWSYQQALIYRWHDLPLSLYYFDCSGENIATYHIKDDYIGFRIKVC